MPRKFHALQYTQNQQQRQRDTFHYVRRVKLERQSINMGHQYEKATKTEHHLFDYVISNEGEH